MNNNLINLENLEERLLHPEPDLRHLTAEQQFERIVAKASDRPGAIVTEEDLLALLKKSKETNKPLKIKWGIDPTGPDIHIGHAVLLLALRLFQRMGHKIQLLIGDFTAMIGDPSGRVEARPALSAEEVERNMASYEQQAARIIDLRDPSIERYHNTEWMNRLTMQEWVEILKQISASALLQREDFRKRLEGGYGISMAELEYAIFMGYDSVVMQPDIELGGIDQYLNMHMCRQMMTNAGQRPQLIITYNILPGTSGARDTEGRLVKMSKSYDNYIPVTAEPADMYGKTMSIPDDVMWIWYRELTEITPQELRALRDSVDEGRIHPKDAKRLLARAVVGMFNDFDKQIIGDAEADFDSKFGKDRTLVPDSVQVVQVDPKQPLVNVLAEQGGKSRGHMRRLVKQQGIYVLRGETYVPITMDELLSPVRDLDGSIVKVGKLDYYELAISQMSEGIASIGRLMVKRLYLAPDFVELFPNYIMFTVVARGIDNTVEHPEIIAMLREAEAHVRSDPILQRGVASHPRVASWRDAFRRFGAKPADHRPSIDALLRRIMKGWEIPYINTVVALSNFMSLKYLIPSGSDDLDQTIGDLGVQLAKGTEPFYPFNAPEEVEYPKPGEVIWADDEKVMCRRWIWRQGDKTKVTPQSKCVTINLDILPPVTREEGMAAAEELAGLVHHFSGGEVIWNMLDRNHLEDLLM